MKPDKIIFMLAFVVILTSFLWITSCKHDADISNFPEMCFARDVQPIFANSCAIAGCHDGTREGRGFTDYASIRSSVVPYKPDKSSSYKAITSTWGEGAMPPGQPISQEKRTIIRLWILQGANETTCATGAAGNKATNDQIVK